MNRFEDFREWLTNLWRPWHSSCLPEEFGLPHNGATMWDATQMLRHARLATACDFEPGIFALLGVEEARRAAVIWSPTTRLITEEMSLAFRLFEKQRQRGEIVSVHNLNRLTSDRGQPKPVLLEADDYRFAASAFQTLMSSKNPSLPATPSSILDLVAWAMPEDLR